jgi:hypothetical protein
MKCRNGSFLGARWTIILCAIALAGCEGTVTVDFGTQAPADPTITSIVVEVDGIQFEKSDGGVQTLEFDSSLPIDLMTYLDGNAVRLFTEETLSDGQYSGVRLVFGNDEDENNRVVLSDGRDFPLALDKTDAFSDVSFTVDKDDSSSDAIQLTLDLRQSLQFDEDNENGTVLTPVIRAIRVEDAGGVAGNVTVSCPTDGSLAVYLFPNEVTPDDRDNADVEPYLTTSIGLDGSTAVSGYEFPYLPEGKYTLATTCNGDEETPSASEDLDFRNAVTIDVEAEESLTRNIP